MKWQQLTEEIARRVWEIGAADQMVTKADADVRWEAMDRNSSKRTEIEWLVGCALIALKERGLIDYE